VASYRRAWITCSGREDIPQDPRLRGECKQWAWEERSTQAMDGVELASFDSHLRASGKCAALRKWSSESRTPKSEGISWCGTSCGYGGTGHGDTCVFLRQRDGGGKI
jgi:hypothetical protein